MQFDLVLTAEKFITAYRSIEKAPTKAAEDIIRYVVKDKGTAAHICDSWGGRKQDWGDFYLNLSNNVRFKILRFWGLGDQEGEKYLMAMEEKPMAMLWADPPDCIKWPTELLKFFYNHGIDERPAAGVTLVTLPSEDRRYGNSTNWGDYILSLEKGERERVLRQIAAYSLERRK